MTLTLLSVYCLFYYVIWLDVTPVHFTFVYQCLPMDWEWFMILNLFAQLIVGLYYYRFLVNEDIGLILVIQTFYPPALRVRMSTQTLLLYDPLLFLLLYLNHIRFHKTLSYLSHALCFFTLLILWFIYIYVHFYVFIYYYYDALCALYIFH